jgi:hypothetical protein
MREFITTSWERLVNIKEINPVEVAEYSVAKSFLDAPDFFVVGSTCSQEAQKNYF